MTTDHRRHAIAAILWVALSVVATACFSGPICDPAPTTPDVTEPANEVLDAAAALDDQLDNTQVDTSLAMAWTDLHNDIQTVVRDAIRDYESVDMNGFRNRLTSLSADISSLDDPAIRRQWGRLVAAFDSWMLLVGGQGGSEITRPDQRKSS